MNNIVENRAKLKLEKQFKELSDKALVMHNELCEPFEIIDTLNEVDEMYETSTNQFIII